MADQEPPQDVDDTVNHKNAASIIFPLCAMMINSRASLQCDLLCFFLWALSNSRTYTFDVTERCLRVASPNLLLCLYERA